MLGGDVNITAADDGLTVDKGYLSQYGGKLCINSVDNGIVADYSATDSTHLDFLGGYTEINTTGEKGHAIATSGKLCRIHRTPCCSQISMTAAASSL